MYLLRDLFGVIMIQGAQKVVASLQGLIWIPEHQLLVFQLLFHAEHFEKWPSLALEDEIVSTPQDHGIGHESHGLH